MLQAARVRRLACDHAEHVTRIQRRNEGPADQGQQFDWREIRCDTETAAKAEAERQQALEDPGEVEWIYLRNKSKQWVARRTPRHLQRDPPRRSETGSLLVEAVTEFFLRK